MKQARRNIMTYKAVPRRNQCGDGCPLNDITVARSDIARQTDEGSKNSRPVSAISKPTRLIRGFLAEDSKSKAT
jgi:hypothetical protein